MSEIPLTVAGTWIAGQFTTLAKIRGEESRPALSSVRRSRSAGVPAELWQGWGCVAEPRAVLE